MRKLTITMLSLMGFLAASHLKAQLPQLNEGNIKEVVAAMTLEEKAKLVVGVGMRFGGGAVVGETQIKVPGAAGTTFEVPRLGIPSIVVADGPAGLRISPFRGPDSTETYYCTAFPVGTLLASTWDQDLVASVGDAIGSEMLSYGVDIWLAPALNIQRNPLCGRNFEYYSEDPVISGKTAASITRGIQKHGVGVSLKHFVANNAETNRMGLNTIVTQRALREIYLRGFEIAVKESDPWTVMSSYNLINGVPASQSHGLLTDVLRTDWGFGGFVMTDWFGGVDAVEQMKAGNDLLMPGRAEQTEAIVSAVNDGSLDESVLDLNVERILEIVVRTPTFKGVTPDNHPDLEAHAKIARQVGAEGMVLLKNKDAALPLNSGAGTIACFGNTSYEIIVGGTGSGDVNEAYSISLIDGLANAGYSLEKALAGKYTGYLEEVKASRPQRRRGFMPPEPIPEMEMDAAGIKSVAGNSDLALITIGRNSGEGRDRTVEDFYLSETEQGLIRNVTGAFHAAGKKVIVVLNIGGVIETSSWREQPDAILLAWQPGQETGNAIADVLTGKVNPSGKLAVTFPVKYEDHPSAATFPGEELPTDEPEDDQGPRSFMRSRPSEVTYDDDIYVGYRYFETFGIETAYEFGYGMSYTTFAYGKPKLSSKKFKGSLTVQTEITNTGKVAGKEVVQLYISAPAEGTNKPVKELRAYAKTQLLEPGESEVVSFIIDPMALSSFDTESSGWVAETGSYGVLIGASSEDIRQEASFELAKPLDAGGVSNVLAPVKPLKVLVH